MNAGSDAASLAQRQQARPWWHWAKRLLKFCFLALIAYLLIKQARSVEWDKVMAAIYQRSALALLAAAGLAAASHLLYACFDLLGKHLTGHKLPARTVMGITFVCYAFNLNLGSLIGGVAMRYRLYSRFGLDSTVITRIAATSMLTNWSGYLLLAGLAFWWRPLPLPAEWKLDSSGLRLLGMAMVAMALAYVLLCALATQRDWTLRGHGITLPPWKLAVVQLLMSCTNWLMISGLVYLLLQQKIDYPTVVAVLLTAAIAGVVTHVPAGLGVLEAVFIALLSQQLGRNELLAALILYRFLYYLAPLVLACVVYFVTEARTQRRSP
ncbi:flippase-like domain-containing protein [Noviherbaspirillum sp. L7-7A]|uniref:lysylphosphatidylglycerol synthase domain-containing protein n=1 Tax=Noviherbaspirillum sp. L7-7A TaxID=2850560 RepID=UPI001C2C856F|nr:lysylphosphatidylglycerol synthase domain-containing protein [Noviherbaspirillum sp. L7-7A]MBV0882254.1 flippase-like domain-containing protein [Noviherbaspirillum sp. L7-7A]